MIERLLNFLGLRAEVLDLRVAFWLTMGMVGLCALGLMGIEGYGLLDAIYMSVITISTVGYGEVEPLSTAGKIFMIFVVAVNIAVVAYALAAFSYYVIEGKIFEQMERKRMQARVAELSGHTIVCGFGRYGREIARHLLEHNREFVIIDEKEGKIDHPEFADHNLIYVAGDATQDETLLEAGIERAGSLITALGDDSDNLFIVLSARDLNPHTRIISRAHQARSRTKMMKAGASHVIMPEQIGGFYMATLISKPGAVEFFSHVTNELDSDIGFEEVRYDQLPAKMRGLSLKGLNLRGLTGVNVIGHRRGGGRFEVNPGPEVVLGEGESFVAVGSEGQVLALRGVLGI